MINYKERVVAELIFKQQVHSLLVTRIEDNVIEVRCSGRIFDAKGNGFTFTTLTAKNKIENLGAYIYTYLTRTLKWNRNLMVIRVDGQSYNFHQLHTHASGSMFIASVKEKNGVPAYTRSDCLNKVLFHSGANAHHRNTHELTVFLNQHFNEVSTIAKAMNEIGLETIRFEFLKQLVNKQNNLSKTLNMAKALYNSLGNETDFAKSHRQVGMVGSFPDDRAITLNHEWFHA
ncbi:hypothetical protein BS028_08945 [Vibrio parahaemolyticus]|nr:hypothetical protein [Vibrio parahaemolyticus]